MNRLKWPEDEPITARIVSRAIENAQKQVEGVNFERRKNVLKYDQVMNEQRKEIYGFRRRILDGEDLRDRALEYVANVIGGTVAQYVSKEVFSEEWDLSGLLTSIHGTYPSDLTKPAFEGIEDADELTEKVLQEAIGTYERREQELGEEVMRELERMVLLSVIDNLWREHLAEMDYLQEGIHLRAYGQRDPLVEYQREALLMFETLSQSLQEEFVRYIYRVEIVRPDEPARPRPQRLVESRGRDGEEGQVATATQVTSQKIPRNAPCPCGSGKKYKKCHGLTA